MCAAVASVVTWALTVRLVRRLLLLLLLLWHRCSPSYCRADRDAYMRQCATETTTQLIHEVFALPDAGRPKDGGRLVSLPDTTTPLPREKPVCTHHQPAHCPCVE
jgi:hypothetical protein